MNCSISDQTQNFRGKIFWGHLPHLVGAQPPPCCSFAGHLGSGKWQSVSHLLITISTGQPFITGLYTNKLAYNPYKWPKINVVHQGKKHPTYRGGSYCWWKNFRVKSGCHELAIPWICCFLFHGMGNIPIHNCVFWLISMVSKSPKWCFSPCKCPIYMACK